MLLLAYVEWKEYAKLFYQKDKGKELMVLITSLFCPLIWFMERDRPGRVEVGYHKFNQVVNPITTVVSVVVSILEKINTFPDTLNTTINLTNIFPPQNPFIGAIEGHSL